MAARTPLIGIAGRIGSGKDAVASYLQEEHQYQPVSFAEPLKQSCLAFGFTREQIYGTQEQKLEVNQMWGVTGRKFMQIYATELMRDLLPKVLPEMRLKRSFWCDLFAHLHREELSRGVKKVVSDCRFQDEVDTIEELGGVILRITRDIDRTGEEHQHVSENDTLSYHHLIVNDGSLEDLFRKVDEVLKNHV